MNQQDSNQLFFRLSGQFFLTHFVTGVVGWVVSIYFPLWSFSFGWQSVAIVGGLTGAIGLLLTLNIARGMQLVEVAITRLMTMQPLKPFGRYRYSALAGLLNRLQQIGERERPFAHLRQQNLEQTQQAAAQEERNRLARDLHDSIKQQLFSISMSSAAVEARWEHDSDGAKTALVDVRQSVQAALTEMNALLQQLAPAPLAQVGFVEALKEQCLALQYRSGAEVVVDVGELPDNGRLPPNTQETLFRVVQEALSNIARHARAKTVHVRLQTDETHLQLSIQDDGQGFTPSHVAGRGLTNMAERIDLLDGHCHLTSTPNKGTDIQIKIPLIQTKQEQEMMEIDNIFNRLAGLIIGGTLGLMVLLAYPLYIVWPSWGLESWSDASTIISSLFLLPAMALLVAMGYMAGRIAGAKRSSAMGWGALVGGSATLLLFYGLASATASVWGNSAIFAHGLTPANSESAGLGLVANSTVSVIWSVHQWLWGYVVMGLLLGGLGGAFAPLRSDPLRWDKLVDSAQASSMVLMMTAMTNLFVAVAIHALLPEQLRSSAIENGFSFQNPVWGVEFWPVFTPAVLYMLANGFLLWLGDKERFKDTSWYRLFYSYLLASINLILVVLTLFIFLDWESGATDKSYTAYFWATMLLGMVWYVLFSLQATRLWRFFDAERSTAVTAVHWAVFGAGLVWLLLIFVGWPGLGLAQLILAWVIFFRVTVPLYRHRDGLKSTYSMSRIIESLGGNIVMFAIGALPIVSHVLGIVLLTIPYISLLVNGETGNAPTFESQINTLFRTQLWSLGITLLLATFLTGILVIGARLVFSRKVAKEIA